MSETPVLNKDSVYDQLATTPPKTNHLNATHRCDSCSAAAYVKVNLIKTDKIPEGSFLLFCGHHFAQNELALMPLMNGKPIDERHKLVYDRQTGTENS